MYYYDILIMDKNILRMVVLRMENQSIIELNLDEMHVSTENPRTKIVIDEIQAIHEIIFEQGDKIIELIKSIIEDGWIIDDLPAICFENDKYIVYEGNRRISSLKCFFNPELLPQGNKTAEKFKKYINSFSKEEYKNLRNKFNKIPVALHESKEIVYKYMEKRHAPNNSKGDTLEKWSTLANERFRNEVVGKKTLVYSVFKEYKDSFAVKDISQFPMSTLERVLKNPNVRKKLKYEFKNDILLVEDKMLFSKYLRQIVQDIDKKIIDSRTLSKSQDIVNYINDIDGVDTNKVKVKGKEKIEEGNAQSTKSQLDNQLSIEKSITNANHNETNNNNKNNEKNENEILGNKRTKVSLPKGLLFSYLEVKTVDINNPDNYGILQIVNELKELSKSKDYKKYPISTMMLIRNLLEQSLKYQLMKLGKWNDLVLNENRKNKNNKEPGLESIIKYCNGNTNIVFANDTKVQRAFRIFASNIGTKEYFDMLVHHPEFVIADDNIIEKIANIGLYRIICNILNT